MLFLSASDDEKTGSARAQARARSGGAGVNARRRRQHPPTHPHAHTPWRWFAFPMIHALHTQHRAHTHTPLTPTHARTTPPTNAAARCCCRKRTTLGPGDVFKRARELFSTTLAAASRLFSEYYPSPRSLPSFSVCVSPTHTQKETTHCTFRTFGFWRPAAARSRKALGCGGEMRAARSAAAAVSCCFFFGVPCVPCTVVARAGGIKQPHTTTTPLMMMTTTTTTFDTISVVWSCPARFSPTH